MRQSAFWKVCYNDLIMIKTKAAHQALYTKYRPQTFDDVVGQEHVIKPIREAIASHKVAHAYLFAGGRGIGKTTIARIIARALDVDDRDIIEIDAASHTGVDDIREIRDGVHTLPFASKYKVYILDEAHMLSKSAFNALLKTLEEPPAHVIFILATTEPEKIPDTIHSRCEEYTFKQPTRDTIAQRVLDVAEREGYTLTEPAADLIGVLANGSFRDGLGVLQKVLTAISEKTIDITKVEEITGAPKTEMLNGMIEAIGKKKLDEALMLVTDAKKGQIDIILFAQLLLERLRAVLLLRVAPQMQETLSAHFNTDDFAQLEALAQNKDITLNSKILKIILEAYTAMPHAHIQSLPLELALIEALEEK